MYVYAKVYIRHIYTCMHTYIHNRYTCIHTYIKPAKYIFVVHGFTCAVGLWPHISGSEVTVPNRFHLTF